MRTVAELICPGGHIYVWLRGKSLAMRFLRDADTEGFTFGDGVKPTQRETSDLFALKPDWTICYVGMWGRMGFYQADTISDEPIVRVDYGKYLSGAEDYVLSRAELCKEREKR